MRCKLAVLTALLVGQVAAAPEPSGIGTPLAADALKPYDIDVRGDGAGLPPGQGSVSQGAVIFAQSCAACHGAGGAHPISKSILLVGGQGTIATPHPVRTVGSYWPYATTLYDYIHRAMPFGAPQSLSPNQVYAVTAYVLHLNGILPADATLDAASLPRVRMPNRDGFISTAAAARERDDP